MNLSLHTSIARRAAMALAASGHTTSGSGGGLLWHHHHDDEILYCCRRFFRLIKPSRDWRAGVPKCAPETPSTVLLLWLMLLASCAALQLGSFKKLVGPALCAPYSVPPNDSFVGEWWWNGSRVMRLYSHPNSDDDIWGTKKIPGHGYYKYCVHKYLHTYTYSFFFKGSQKHVKLLYKRRSFNMWVFHSNAIVVPFA